MNWIAFYNNDDGGDADADDDTRNKKIKK